MKKTIIAFVSLLVLASCDKNESNTNLQLTGTIKGLKKGTLYIQKIKDSSLVALDTIIIDGDSKFESDLNIASPEMLYLFLDRAISNSLDNNISFFAEPGKNQHRHQSRFLYWQCQNNGLQKPGQIRGIQKNKHPLQGRKSGHHCSQIQGPEKQQPKSH